jgi:hypothetical protein
MTSPSTGKPDLMRVVVLSLMALIVGAAAITHQSFWMDEGSTAFKALMPTFSDWIAMTYRIGGSDVQMPLYMFAVWAWEKTGLNSEFLLRSINLPFLVLMVLALRKVRFWPLVCLISPFVLYYVGELRPYTLQMAAGAVAAAGLASVITNRGSVGYAGLHLAAAGSLLLTLGSLTSGVWAIGVVAAILVLRPEWLRQKRFWLHVLPWCFAAIGVFGYYAFTLHQGYRATASGGGGLLSLGFGFYELSGLLGIGPSRDELRASPTAIIRHLPWIVPAFLCIFAAWLLGFRDWAGRQDRRTLIAVGLALLIPITTLAVVGVIADFRVLGRHLSPAIPAVLLPLALCWEVGLRKKSASLALAAAASLILLASSLSLRFQEKHARDDYRTATTIAIDALKQGKQILWLADMNAARHYAYHTGGMPYINALQQLESDPPSLLFADIIVINRPDIRFKSTDFRKELQKNGFTQQPSFTGFEVWKSQ